MSYNNLNNMKMVDKSLVDKILEQGQKLRNAMVGSILKNDPFNTEIIYNKHFNTPQTSRTDLTEFKNVDNLTSFDERRLEAFIKGEYMTKEEEKLALDSLRTLSAPALCKTTEKSLNSAILSSCRCYTCTIYNSNNLYCDLRRKNKQNADHLDSYSVNDITRGIQEKYKIENGNILKYVDSLKVSISSLVLNEMGNQKVSFQDEKRVPYNPSQTYFLEYSVPDPLVNKSVISKSKVDSGLESKHVRLCSRKNNDTISFKQVTIHDVKNLDSKVTLDQYELRFKISYRTAKQKIAGVLGFAKFNFSSFLLSKNLTCHRGLSVFLNENSPIVVGTLKVSLQLGCGRLYFGQEFIDAINSPKPNSVVLDSDESASQLNKFRPLKQYDDYVQENAYQNRNIDVKKQNEELLNYSAKSKLNDTQKSHSNRNNHVDSIQQHAKSVAVQKLSKQSSYFLSSLEQSSRKSSGETRNVKSQVDGSVLDGFKNQVENKLYLQQISDNEKQILFGFLYISEAQYLSTPINTYITCRPFCQNETSCSNLVTNSTHPVFNFSQLVPLIFEDDLLHLLRENYMIIEFWQKTDSTDIVIGLTKIFLHQFYLAYRNPIILKYLSKNQLPIIGTDWWEPIYAINTEEVLGQVQVLVALGTEQQINNLKAERGFTNNIVRAKSSFPKPAARSTQGITLKKSYQEIHPKITADFKEKKCECNEVKTPSEQVNNLEFKGNKFTNDFSGATAARFKQKNSLEVEEKQKFTTDKAVNVSISPKTVNKLDVGVQSNIEMDRKEEPQEKEKNSPTQEMLGSFLNQLIVQRQRNIFVENSTNTDAVEPSTGGSDESLRQAQTNTNVELRKTTDLLDSLQKALSLDGVYNFTGSKKKSDTFRASIAINSANHLPSRKKCKSKKSRNRSLKNEENVLPSCYVTFETVSERDLKITPVISKSTSPVWNYKNDVDLPIDLLTNNQKRLIFKVWRKSTNAVMQPNMETDTVLGFAAVDLTVLLAGFPNVQGWFNIVDFSGKCNGQINIHITPLENLSRYEFQKECNCNVPLENAKPVPDPEPTIEPAETLSRALKRKFTELDEITQRLRLRLSKVTNEDSDASSDGIADEFEKDINTLCIEEDFNLINFDEDARKFNVDHTKENMESNGSSKCDLLGGLVVIDGNEGCKMAEESMQVGDDKKLSSSDGDTNSEGPSDALTIGINAGTEQELASLDKQLLQGKQRIDTLLEKLSLLSADTNNPFTSRYVSGCSINSDHPTNIDTEAILKELDHSSRPNIQSTSGFDPIVFQQLYGGSIYSKSNSLDTPQTSTSGTSLITNFSDCRAAPDGQGNISDEKLVKK